MTTTACHPIQWYADQYGKAWGRNRNFPNIKVTAIHLISIYLVGVHLTGVRLLQMCATRGHAGFDFRRFLVCPRRHPVLGGTWWCVMVPPNGTEIGQGRAVRRPAGR
jgi:hypothetical protein